MTNGNQGARLYAEVLRSISKTYNWDILKTKIKKAIKLPEEQLKNYVGRYQHLIEHKYQVEIAIKENLLEVHQLWYNIRVPIFAENPYHFFECEEGLLYNFIINQDGSIKELNINGDMRLIKVE